MWIDKKTGEKVQLLSMDNNATYKIGDAEITVTANEFNTNFREATTDELKPSDTGLPKKTG